MIVYDVDNLSDKAIRMLKTIKTGRHACLINTVVYKPFKVDTHGIKYFFYIYDVRAMYSSKCIHRILHLHVGTH